MKGQCSVSRLFQRKKGGGAGMGSKRKWIVTSGLCIALILGNCLAVSANVKNETITVEYAEYGDIQESVQSDSGETVVLTYVEKVGDIYQVVYQDADAIGDSNDSGAAHLAVVDLDKTIVKGYATFEEISTSTYYREYTYDTWFSGILSLQKAEKVGMVWQATYSGKITGSIWH